MNGGNVKDVGTKEWKDASFADKFKACLWYNREIKEICFGGGIAAFFQAAFTVLDKTVKNMNAIYKALHLRDAIVDAVQTTKAEEVNAALDMLKPNDNDQNQSVAQANGQPQAIQTKIQEFLTLADVNSEHKTTLITHLNKKIGAQIHNVLNKELSVFNISVFNIIEKGITSERKSEDVKKQLAEATTKFDEDVKALLDAAVKNGAISEKDKEHLLNQVDTIKTEKTQSINKKLVTILQKEQAARQKANAGKTEEQLLDGLDGKLSDADKQTLKQVRDAAKATVDSAEKERAKQFLNLVVSELKEGREVSNLTKLLVGENEKIGKEIFDAINRGNLNRDMVKNKQIYDLTNLTKNLSDETFRKQLFKESQFAQDCARLNGKNPVDVYGMTCDDNVPKNIKTIIGEWRAIKFDSRDTEAVDKIREELGSEEQDINNLYRDYAAKAMSDLYVAMEGNSQGSGAQLLFTYCQTVDGTVLNEFNKEMREKKLLEQSVNFSMQTVQADGHVVPINTGNLPARNLSMHFSGNPTEISYGYHVDCKFVIYGGSSVEGTCSSFLVNQIVGCIADVKYSYKNEKLECSQVHCLTAVSEDGVRLANLEEKKIEHSLK